MAIYDHYIMAIIINLTLYKYKQNINHNRKIMKLINIFNYKYNT